MLRRRRGRFTGVREATIAFAAEYPLAGFGHVAHRVLESDVVAASRSTVRRLLKPAGLLQGQSVPSAVKGQALCQALCHRASPIKSPRALPISRSLPRVRLE